MFEDGIQVKRQKEHRYSAKRDENPEDTGSERKQVNNDVLLVEKAKGGFEYLTTPKHEDGKPMLSLELMAKAKLIDEYGAGTSKEPLNIDTVVNCQAVCC